MMSKTYPLFSKHINCLKNSLYLHNLPELVARQMEGGAIEKDSQNAKERYLMYMK